MSIPEPDMSVSSAPSRSQKATLVRTPTDSFDGCFVLAELSKGLVGMKRPNQKFVIVTSRSQLLVIKTPFKAAYLLFVTRKLTVMISRSSQVTLEDVFVATPRAYSGHVPRDRTHAR